MKILPNYYGTLMLSRVLCVKYNLPMIIACTINITSGLEK